VSKKVYGRVASALHAILALPFIFVTYNEQIWWGMALAALSLLLNGTAALFHNVYPRLCNKITVYGTTLIVIIGANHLHQSSGIIFLIIMPATLAFLLFDWRTEKRHVFFALTIQVVGILLTGWAGHDALGIQFGPTKADASIAILVNLSVLIIVCSVLIIFKHEQKQILLSLDQANKELTRLVRVDPLSNIPNRRAYSERLAIELAVSKRQAKPLSLLIVDIDYFKKYNDTYGHERGDIAIQSVATALKKALPREIDFVSRFGGEEFVILLPSTNDHGARTVCAAILDGIASLKIDHKNSQCSDFLSVSIGASSTESGSPDLFKQADYALYYAKGEGRNQYKIYDHKAENELE